MRKTIFIFSLLANSLHAFYEKILKNILVYCFLVALFISCDNQPQVTLLRDNPQVFITDSLKFTYSLTDKDGNYTNVFRQNSWLKLTMEIENTTKDTIITINNNMIGDCYSASTNDWIEQMSFTGVESDTVKDLFIPIAPYSSVRKTGVHSATSVTQGKYYFKSPDILIVTKNNGVSDTISYTTPLSILFEIE